MKKFGVVGYRGKLGSILIGRPNFVSINCNITDLNDVKFFNSNNTRQFDVIVNLGAISSVDECEKDYDKAIQVNTHGLANLHKVFGERVLNISSDQVFSGNSWFLPDENTKPNPINNYGFTKVGAEGISKVFGGKTLRLSRTVSLQDNDIGDVVLILQDNEVIEVPIFFQRNYMHREFAVAAIEYMVRNWDTMPQIVNYGGTDHITLYKLMWELAVELGLDHTLLQKNNKYDDAMTPRPKNGGFKVDLARKLGFPMYSVLQTVQKLREEFNG